MKWRTNLCKNPRGQISTVGWNNSGLNTFAIGTLGQDGFPAASSELQALGIDSSFHGVADTTNDQAGIAFQMVKDVTYQFAVFVYVEPASTAPVQISIGESEINATEGIWQRLSVSEEFINSGFTSAVIRQDGAGATDFYWTAALIEQSDSLGEFFDGDVINGNWDGPEFISASHFYLDQEVISAEFIEQFEPLMELYGPMPDLEVFMGGLSRPMQIINNISADEEEATGWSQLLDRERAHHDWLRWLGQWVGYYVPEVPQSLEVERSRIVSRSAHRRGSIAMLREAVQEHLAEPKDVFIQERTTSAYHMTIFVVDDQIITSAAKAEAAARAQKAAGLILTFTVLTGADYSLLNASNASYTEVNSAHANYTSVLTNPGL